MKKILSNLGLILIIASVFYDFLAGNPVIVFGKAQWVLLIVGVLLIIAGRMLKTNLVTVPDGPIRDKYEWFINNIYLKIDRNLDLFIILFFILVGISFFLGRWQGNIPFLDLGGDAANVATYAAVLDHPENFKNDFYFNDKQNFSYYVSFHVPYLRAFAPIFGGYGLAYLTLLIPIISIHGTGFYFLGKAFYKNRIWAFILALTSLIIIYTESMDYWGIYEDPQPRMLFGAFFPWVLLLAYRSLENSKLRVITMICVGLMLYINPVSVPGVALSIWLSFLIFKPKETKISRHLLEMLLYGAIFLIITIPFLVIYLQSREIVPSGVNYSDAINYFESSYMAMFNVKDTLFSYLTNLSTAFLLPLAIVSSFLVYNYTNKKRELSLLLVWILGIFLVAIGLTYLVDIITKETETIPFLLQMTRDLRYIVPLLEIIVFLPISYRYNLIKDEQGQVSLRRYAYLIVGIGILYAFVYGFREVTKERLEMNMYAQKTVNCLFTKQVFCLDQGDEDLEQLMTFIRGSTETDATFISLPPVDINDKIRYEGLRSIVFDVGDIRTMRLVDISKGISMTQYVETWNRISHIVDPYERQESYIHFAEELSADYAVAQTFQDQETEYNVVFSNDSYSVIQLVDLK